MDIRRDARLPVDVLSCASALGPLEPVGELLRCASLLIEDPTAVTATPVASSTSSGSIYTAVRIVCVCVCGRL